MKKLLLALLFSLIACADGTIVTGRPPSCNGVTNGYLYTASNNKCVFSAPPASGVSIGDTIGSATVNSVLYIGTAGVLAQDNANLQWDFVNHRFQVASGTVSTPSYGFAAEGNLGMYRAGTGTLGFAAGGATVAYMSLASGLQMGSNGNYRVDACETDAGNSGTTLTVNFGGGNCKVQKVTLTGNVTLTLSNPVIGGSYTLRIVQGAASYTVTWPASVKWPSGTAPVITVTNGKIDIINLLWDGTSYYGTFDQNY